MRNIDDHGQALVRTGNLRASSRLGSAVPRPARRTERGRAREPPPHVRRPGGGSAARAPEDAVLCGTTAAWVHGVDQATAGHPIEVGARHGRRVRSVDGRISRGRTFRPVDVQDSDWGLITTPARTAYDLARDPVLLRSVPRLDALVRSTGLVTAEVWPVVEHNPGARWITAVPRTLDLVDPGAESVRESSLRVLLALEGFPRLVAQHDLHDVAGAFVARLDLAHPELRVGVEYDGAYHLDPVQAATDRVRRARVRANGWGLLVVDNALFGQRETLFAAVADLFDRARRPGW
ncbi:hypothetical protein NKG05_21230 [Oerskovia sp. M15]